MNPDAIRDAADVRRIETRPYAEFMPHTSVLRGLEASAQVHAAHTALCYLPDEDLATPARRWSYSAFVREVRRAANLFQQLTQADSEADSRTGAGAGMGAEISEEAGPGTAAGSGPPAVRVALLLPAIPQAYFALWGAEAAGIACPVNYLLSTEHICELLQASRCNILVALGPHDALDLTAKVAAVRERCPQLHHVLWVDAGSGGKPLAMPGPDFDALRAAQPASQLRFERVVQADTVAALFHTGGTTGLPKLAQHTHGNQLHSAWGAAQMYATSRDDCIVNGFPIFHVAGSLVFGLSTLLAGGTVLLPTLLGLRNVGFMRRYWSFAARERVTLVTATPTGIATLLNTPRDGADLRRVRALLTGGAPLPTELALGFEDAFGLPVRNTLGMTECAGVVSIEPVFGPRTPGSCGLPLPFTEVQVVATAQVGDPAAPALAANAPGIVRLRGPNVSPGYTDAARNTGTFEAGWLVSGDIGHRDAGGRVFITGRAKDVIIRNSHNIDPAQIEEALMKHPDVLLAAAVGEPDEYAGELPVAFVVARPGATLEGEALRRFVEQHIAERPALPKRIEVLAELPQTAVGKVYKPTLRLRAIERVLRDRLASAGLDTQAQVDGEDAAHGLGVVFTPLGTTAPDALATALKRLMRDFALRYRIADRPDGT